MTPPMLRRTIACAICMFFPWISGCLSFHQGALPGEPKKATYAAIAGARIRYLDTAEGAEPSVAAKPAVVLLHGFASALETWSDVIPVLSEDHRVIALDLKGFGWSDRPEGDYSPAAQARIVLELMRQRGVERAAVVAHSWGASIALEMALLEPERVTRLALYDAWVYEAQLPTMFHWVRAEGWGEMLFAAFYKERAGDKIAHAFHDPAFVTEELVESVERALERPGTEAAALAAVRGQRFAAIEKRYRTIPQETLLLWGREDQVTYLTHGERLAADLPHARLVVYPRCGHFPMIEAKHASNAELASFLRPGGR